MLQDLLVIEHLKKEKFMDVHLFFSSYIEDYYTLIYNIIYFYKNLDEIYALLLLYLYTGNIKLV